MELVVILLSCAATACGSWYLSKIHSKVSPTELERQVEKLANDLIVTKSDLNFSDALLQTANKTLAEVKSQRDDYARLASSHNVIYPKIKVKEDVFNREFIYFANIETNLQNIRKDLEYYGPNAMFHVNAVMYVIGEFKDFLVNKKSWSWGNDPKKPNEEANKVYVEARWRWNYNFSGNADKVTNEIELALKDPTWHLFSDGKCQFPNAPIKLLLTTQIRKVVNQEQPEIQIVEVLKVQKEVQIVEVEKPVYIYENKKDGAELPHNIEDIIAAKIEVELAMREKTKLVLKRAQAE